MSRYFTAPDADRRRLEPARRGVPPIRGRRPHHHRGDPVTAATLISPTLAALQSIERDYDHGMADIHRHYRRQLDALFAADIN